MAIFVIVSFRPLFNFLSILHENYCWCDELLPKKPCPTLAFANLGRNSRVKLATKLISTLSLPRLFMEIKNRPFISQNFVARLSTLRNHDKQ